MIRFLVDAQLPPAFAWSLRRQGYAAEHVAERKLEVAADREIWDEAIRLGACIITKDEDFVHRRLVSKTGPVVVWIRVPNLRRRYLVAWFDRVIPEVLAGIERGEILIELI